MKKYINVAVLLLAGLTFTHAADKYAPRGNTLADALQWLAVQTACVGQYNMAETGDFTAKDPQDYYQAPDIREYLARMSGDRTRVAAFYGICFDYAKAAYDYMTASSSYYANLGVKEWYMAATWAANPNQIKLFDPVPRGQHTTFFNGAYMKEKSRHNVQNHGNKPMNHAWLWVIGNDDTIYWIDPTWTDNAGYIVWGVVRNGREEQAAPHQSLCAGRVPGGIAFASLSRGDANKSQGNWDQAIIDYDEAIRVEPNYPLIYNNRGLANYNKGVYDQAIADFNEAIRLNPNYADAYRNRGRAYYAKGGYDQAMADFDKALSLNPDDAPAYNGRAYVYLAKKDYIKALADASKAVGLLTREAVYHTTRGEILISMGQKKLARTELEIALRLAPTYTPARDLLRRAR
jgi:tetratricopeptide (TPR) repeat protein